MAISDTMQKAFNDQFNAELQAALVYKQLGLELDRLSLVGMRDWMREQVDEEFGHAHAFSDHILARGGQVTISTLSVDSRQLIDRFLTEQIEEEDTVNEILDRLELVGDDGAGILRLDAELGQR